MIRGLAAGVLALAALASDGGKLEACAALLEQGRCELVLEQLLELLHADETDAGAAALLERTLHDPRHVAGPASERAWTYLRLHPKLARASLANPGEPGQPLMLRGVVRDAVGAPLSNALLHVYQTDATGHYTPTKVMDEPHARLFAYVLTGADGRFELATIRPGAYPVPPERSGVEWQIPQHVHIDVEREGSRSRRVQVVFDDDPRMAPAHWREWARSGRQPIVAVERNEQGVQHAELEIALD